jgi:hypothetical protein
MAGLHNLVIQRGSGICLPSVQCHQALNFQFLHRGQVHPVQSAAMGGSRIAMLFQRGGKNCRGQKTKMKGLKIAHGGKLCLIVPPLTRTDFASQRHRFQMDLDLELCQRRNNNCFFNRDCVANIRALRLIDQQFGEATRVEINHLLFDLKERSARFRASASSVRNIFPPATFFCQRACAATSQRGRLSFCTSSRTSLATGFESRVIRISFSTSNAASASGQRCRKSRIVMVFTPKG